MNRVVSICSLFVLALVCLGATASALAQNRGVIVAKSAPVHIGSVSPSAVRERRTNSSSASVLERQVFQILNDERQKRGLAPLVWDDRVARIARQHSRDMAQQNYFSHQGKDGLMVTDRASRNGIPWMGIGENIVYFQGYDDPAHYAADSWMNSTGHRKNILGKDWQESGIGAAIAPDGSYYLTQVFINAPSGYRLAATAKAAQNSSNNKPKAILVDEF